MSLSILSDIPALAAQSALNTNQTNMQNTLVQLSTGQRINSGADDPAGLAIANGLQVNISALTQSQQNVNDGIGQLQVVDGALGQVTDLLNTAVTLATEASNGTENSSQLQALNDQFTSIKTEIDNIGSNTNFNGANVFTASTTSIFLSDAGSSYTIGMSPGTLSSANIAPGSGATGMTAVDLSGDNLLTNGAAQTALTAINSAVANVANNRGAVGATINQMQAATNVVSAQVQNLTAAESGIMDANIPSVVNNLSQEQTLAQTGMSALSSAIQSQQLVLKLLG
ncbi:MAG: flagellin [Terriglobales bacterium]